MPIVENNDVDAAVVRPAFRGLVAGNGDGVGKTGNLEPFFLYAQSGQIVEYGDRTRRGKVPVRRPDGRVSVPVVGVPLYPEFPPRYIVRGEVTGQPQ